MDDLKHALSLLQAGQAGAACDVLLAAPAGADRDFLLGACRHALGDIPSAITAFTSALRAAPDHAQAACALASLYAGLGHRGEAIALLRRTLARVDEDGLRFNLGVALEDSGDAAGALAEYGRVLARTPGHFAARHNRAGLLARLQRLAEAAADYRELVHLHPQHVLAWHNLGELELALGHYEAAIASLGTALHHHPDNGKALLSLAVAHAANGDIDASRARFAALRALDPARWEDARRRLNGDRGRDRDIDPRLLFLVRQESHLQVCNWRHWPRYGEVFRDFLRAPGDGDALALGYASMLAPLRAQEQLTLGRHIAAQVERRGATARHTPTPTPSRLRIGYAGTRLGMHVTGLIFRPLFAAHDPAQVEVHVLALGPDDGSAEFAALRTLPGLTLHELGEVDDDAAAAHIRALELDVLVDLAVWNDQPRPEVLAARPAPLQVVWQGAAYSSGAPWLDYVVADATVRPGEDWCSEAEVLLPGSFFFYPGGGLPVAPPRETLGLPADKFVFASLNTACKLEPGVFDSWMRILAQCPDSVLWLLASGGAAQILNLKREAEWRGIDPRRLLFANRVTPAAHVARQGAADLFLDTFHVNGHTTMAESLWAGTPALSCPGNTFASRVGASLLQAAGLPELVLADAAAYEAMAVALYRDRERLAMLRRRLAEARAQLPHYQPRLRAAQMERVYRHMRERFAAGLPPAAFALADLPG